MIKRIRVIDMAISDEAQKRIEETDKVIEEKYLKPPKGFKTNKEYAEWLEAYLEGEEWAVKRFFKLKKPK
jgi:hypothetical protein